MTGIVDVYVYTRKFGFIQSDNKRYFFHVTSFTSGGPTLGARVEFDLGEPFQLGRPKQAINIRVLEDSAAAQAAQALVDAAGSAQEGGKGGAE